MRISDWSSDVCSSDLFVTIAAASHQSTLDIAERYTTLASLEWAVSDAATATARDMHALGLAPALVPQAQELLSFLLSARTNFPRTALHGFRSEEHTSELQSLMLISYAVSFFKTTNYHF